MQIPLVNVYDDMRARTDTAEMFLQVGSAGGHYSNAGNALTADALYKSLSEMMPPR